MAEDHTTRMRREKREAFVGRTLRMFRVLLFLAAAEEACPTAEVKNGLTDGKYDWDEHRRIEDTLRRLLAMDLVANDKRQYESVTRWELTEHGDAFLAACSAGEADTGDSDG